MKDIFTREFIDKDFELTCENCWRVLPNDKFFTKNGCVWCTTEEKEKK